MSGRKSTYVLISEDELQRLRQEAAEASAFAQSNEALFRLHEMTERLMLEQQDRLSNLNEKMRSLTQSMEQREAASSQERQELRWQLSDTIARTDKALQDMAERNARDLETMQSGFMDALDRTREDMTRIIDRNNRQVEQAIHSAVAGLEEQIGDVSNRVNRAEQSLRTIRQSNEVLLEMAREYLDTACILMQNCEESFRFELLLPGQAEAVRGAIRDAGKEIKNTEQLPTNAPAACQEARAALKAVMSFRENLARAEQEWQLHYQQARQVLNVAEVKEKASRKFTLSGAEEEVFTVDVDFWTNGDLTNLNGRIQSLNGALDKSANLKLEDLDNIQGAGIQIIKELQEATEFAAIAVHASADRYEIAEEVAACLAETLGLGVESDGYQGGDLRGAHRVHLFNPLTKFDMVVTQTPQRDKNAVLGNRLEVDILDYGTNSVEDGDKIVRQAMQALRQALQIPGDLGLRQENVETVTGFEEKPSDRKQFTDMRSWKHNRAEIPQPDHGKQSETAEPPGRTAVTERTLC